MLVTLNVMGGDIVCTSKVLCLYPLYWIVGEIDWIVLVNPKLIHNFSVYDGFLRIWWGHFDTEQYQLNICWTDIARPGIEPENLPCYLFECVPSFINHGTTITFSTNICVGTDPHPRLCYDDLYVQDMEIHSNLYHQSIFYAASILLELEFYGWSWEYNVLSRARKGFTGLISETPFSRWENNNIIIYGKPQAWPYLYFEGRRQGQSDNSYIHSLWWLPICW